jgi:hypothetical protein
VGEYQLQAAVAGTANLREQQYLLTRAATLAERAERPPTS